MHRNSSFLNIPDANLKKILIKKAEDSNQYFELLVELNTFSKSVLTELPFIWETFPEYTPHDENHHIKNLLQSAEKLISDNFKQFSFLELFLFIAGIYAHDWGMAIPRGYKTAILNQSVSISKFPYNQTILNNERIQFLNFVKKIGLMIESNNNYENIDDSIWQKFIRETHAKRSGSKIKDYFSQKNPSIGDAISKICMGHSLDFHEIDNSFQYPENLSILNDTINLKAITLYLRIIDLLDIGESRAPIAIYNFISPKSVVSKKHWQINQAIKSVSFSSISKNMRQIIIEGSTDNVEIYAELEDYISYFKTQIEKTYLAFAHMHDNRHKFDIFHLKVNIKNEGFKPISIKFEFERNNVFQILSSEVYHRDPYVFLRELLQNSIDAIKLKQIFYKKENPSKKFNPIISVDIQYLDDGKIKIKWFDNGIGMDEYVIKNYLSVIGKSFYDKENLDLLGINLNPISKFGIGILSCFYISDELEILTYKDQIISPNSVPLKISIFDVNSHFVVKELGKNSIKQGTEISIISNEIKFQKENDKLERNNSPFTSYLSNLAGFVEYPIIITERNCTVTIVHPYYSNRLVQLKKKLQNIRKIDFEYPLKRFFFPHYLDNAKFIFTEIIIDLKFDLSLKDYEGAISFLDIPDNFEWISRRNHDYFGHEERNNLSLYNLQNLNNRLTFQIINFSDYFFYKNFVEEKKDIVRNPFYAVFKNGILLQNEERFHTHELYFFKLSPGCYNVNIKNNQGYEIDIARTFIMDSKTPWQSPIKSALLKYFIKNILDPLFLEPVQDRWYHIGQKIGIYPIDPEMLISNISNNHIPILTLESGGKVSFDEIGSINDELLYSIPEELLDDIILYCKKIIFLKKNMKVFYKDGRELSVMDFLFINHIHRFFSHL